MAKVGRLVKERMVEELSEALKGSTSVLITSIGPLKAAEADSLRKRLRGSQARMFVAKRTLGERSVSALSRDDRLATLLSGSVAFVIPGDDVVKTAKIVVEFAKANEGKLTVRGGWVEGQVLSDKSVEAIASLPPKPQLIAEVVGALEAPFANLLWTLEYHLSDLAWVVEEVAKRHEGGQQE
jgi:large subunit ribosomal protein L10